jgi:hypothetical protein
MTEGHAAARRRLVLPFLGAICVLGCLLTQAGAASASTQPPRPRLISRPAGTGNASWRRVVNAPFPETLFPATSHPCPAWRERWLTQGSASVALVVWTCQQSHDPAAALWRLLLTSGKPGVSYGFQPLAQDPDAWTRSLSPQPVTGGQRETIVYLARANYLIAGVARAPAGPASSPAGLAAGVIRQEAALLPGPEHRITLPPPVTKAVAGLLSGILLAYLLILLIRYGRNPLRRQRYEVRRGDERWIDVSSAGTRLKWSVRFRALMRALFALNVLVVLSDLLSAHIPASTVINGIYLAVSLWFGWIRPVGRLLRDWQPRRIRGVYLRHHPRAWLEPVFAAASFACLTAVLVACLTGVLIYALGIAQSPLVVNGVLDPRYLNAIPGWAEITLTLLVAVPANDLIQVTAIAALLLLAAATLLRRLGRRFALADAEMAQRADKRPPVLYLRNFGDDALRMPSSSLARTSFTERLSVVRQQPFEEILARHLRRYGPFIALARPGTRLPTLGAAKVERDTGTWLSQIQEWAPRAAMVVVAAAPREVSDGLRTEIELLAETAVQVPVLLVVSPYRRREIEARWRRFCDEAARPGRFGGLAHFREHNSGAHFLAYKPGAGWQAWGAATRSEFSYAVSLAAAWEAATARPLAATAGT